LKVVGTTNIDYKMLSLAEFKPSAGRIFLSRRRPQICGLAEFKPKSLLLTWWVTYYISLHGITSCYITSHYITLHHIVLHCIKIPRNRKTL